MNQKTILIISIVLFVCISLFSTIMLTLKVEQISIEGKIVGNASLTINQECGNIICVSGENCTADASYCTDNTCYEPTCSDGCGQTAVASGSTDEGCSGNTGCSGGNCQCNGTGSCFSGPSLSAGGDPSGGGGEKLKEKKGINVLTERIKSLTKVNEELKQRISIQNLDDDTKTITIEVEGIQNIINIIDSFTLKQKEIKTIPFDVFSSDPGVFTGKIIIITDDQREEIPVIIEVETKQVLFDLSIDLKPKSLNSGEKITATITVFNVNEIGRVNVDIEYIIKDFNNKIILQDKEVITIETQATLSKSFTVPQELPEGEYVFIIQALYQGTRGTSSESFSVGKVELPLRILKPLSYLIMIPIALVICIIIVFIIRINRMSKIERTLIKKAYNREDLKKIIKIQRLRKKEKALEKALRKGYISRESYEEGKKELERIIRKLK